MSDLLTIRGIGPEPATRLLQEWATARPWVRSAELRRRWEAAELEINGRNAARLMRGKHKTELAELVLLVEREGGRVVHVMLRDDRRVEADRGPAERRSF